MIWSRRLTAGLCPSKAVQLNTNEFYHILRPPCLSVFRPSRSYRFRD